MDIISKVILLVALVVQCVAITGLVCDASHQNLYIVALEAVLFLIIFALIFKKQNPKGGVPSVPPNVPLPPHDSTPPHDPTVSPIQPVDEEKVSYFDNYIKHISSKHGLAAGHRTREDVEDLLGNSAEGDEHKVGRINELLDEQEEPNKRVKGLVVGRVQSGKTQNFTGLITKAIDEGWKTIVVLTSNNIALKAQTVMRLKYDLKKAKLEETQYQLIEDFTDEDIQDVRCDGKVVIGVALKQADHLRGRNNNGRGVAGWLEVNRDALRRAKVLLIDDESDNATPNGKVGSDVWSDETARNYAERLSQHIEGAPFYEYLGEWAMSFFEEEVILDDDELVRMKNDLSLEARDYINRHKDILRLNRTIQPEGQVLGQNLADVLKHYIELQNEGLGRGHLSRSQEFLRFVAWILGVQRERSVVNQAVCDLVDPKMHEFGALAYIGYTATPYANFLNERRGAQNPLALDFAQSMQIALEYFGLSNIFGEDVDDPVPRMPIVREIQPNESDNIFIQLDRSAGISLPNDGTPFVVRGNNGENVEWKSLKEAVCWSFCCAAIRRAKRLADNRDAREDRWTTMLVNISRECDNHNRLRNTIYSFIANSLDNAEAFKQDCKRVFDEFAKAIDRNRFEETLPDYGHEVEDVQWRDVEEQLEAFTEKKNRNASWRVEALNSDGENAAVYNAYIQAKNADEIIGDVLWIIVGGNRISRGLTFDGLVSSYFDRATPNVNVDTLTQMGRWFGYRMGYELLPRVWLMPGCVRTLKEICRLEEELHEEIAAQFEKGEIEPNPRMRQISIRLTGRDAGIVTTEGVGNPYTVRDYRAERDAILSVQQSIGGFIDNLDENLHQHNPAAEHVYGRLHNWRGLSGEKARELQAAFSPILDESEAQRLAIVFGKLQESGFDLVLADAQARSAEMRDTVASFGDIELHVAGVTGISSLQGGYLRYGKFSGQYDAWKTVVPPDIVKTVENEPGFSRRSNSDKANQRRFELMRQQGCEVRPIVQLGFVPVPDWAKSGGLEAIPYIAFLFEGDEIAPAVIRQGNVLDATTAEREVVVPTAEREAVATTPAPTTPPVNAPQINQTRESDTIDERKCEAVRRMVNYLKANGLPEMNYKRLWRESGADEIMHDKCKEVIPRCKPEKLGLLYQESARQAVEFLGQNGLFLTFSRNGSTDKVVYKGGGAR